MFFAAGLTMYFERTRRPLWVTSAHYVSMWFVLMELAGIILLPTRSDFWVGIAVAMYMLAFSLFLGAIETAKRTRLQRSFIDYPLPDRLITDGPFRWVRHPFCTGYLLGALAGPVAIDHVLMLITAVPLVVIPILAARREERVWMSGPRTVEYSEYRRRTGMFIPFIGRG